MCHKCSTSQPSSIFPCRTLTPSRRGIRALGGSILHLEGSSAAEATREPLAYSATCIWLVVFLQELARRTPGAHTRVSAPRKEDSQGGVYLIFQRKNWRAAYGCKQKVGPERRILPGRIKVRAGSGGISAQRPAARPMGGSPERSRCFLQHSCSSGF